jgi:Uma2 family endonuclease
LLGEGWFYRQQEPITLSDGEPDPDGAVIRGSKKDYRTRHPTPDDLALVIEVADSTLARDRGIKLRSYARAGIALYWIINLIDRCVEVYAQPDSSRPEPTYLSKEIREETDSIAVTIAGMNLGTITVRDLLP